MIGPKRTLSICCTRPNMLGMIEFIEADLPPTEQPSFDTPEEAIAHGRRAFVDVTLGGQEHSGMPRSAHRACGLERHRVSPSSHQRLRTDTAAA